MQIMYMFFKKKLVTSPQAIVKIYQKSAWSEAD